jgi:hypothetical protein
VLASGTLAPAGPAAPPGPPAARPDEETSARD